MKQFRHGSDEPGLMFCKEVPMQVHFITNEFFLTPSLRDYLSKRIQFAFVALQNRIATVSVRLRDLNGPRGGRDMLCQLSVVIPGRPKLLIKDIQEDMYVAIDCAVKRASYRASRLIERQREAVRKVTRPAINEESDSH